MTHLGKYWADAPTSTANCPENKAEIAAYHRIDIAGAASSILATPTIKSLGKLTVFRGFCAYAEVDF